jgi:hypothetical protein
MGASFGDIQKLNVKKKQRAPKWRKIQQQEAKRRHHQGIVDSFEQIAVDLRRPMREKAAVYPQKIFRGRISRRYFWCKRNSVTGKVEMGGPYFLEIATEKAAKKLQAVFR